MAANRRRLLWRSLASAALVSLVGSLLLFGPALQPGMVTADFSAGGDTYRHLVNWAVAGQTVRAGHAPLWLPELGHGFPLWASFQWGLGSPAFLLFVLLPVELAHSLSAIGHLVLGGCGMYLLARRSSAGHHGALIAATGYSLSNFFVSRIVAGHIFLVWPMAWAPWALWALERAVAVPSARRVCVAAALLCLALTAGHVQMAIYVMLIVVVWSSDLTLLGLRRVGSSASASRWATRWGRGRTCCVVLILAVGLAAVQWVPFLDLLGSTLLPPWSDRLLHTTSLSPVGLWSFILPHVFGLRSEGSFFGSSLDHELVSISSGILIWLCVVGGIWGSRRRMVALSLLVVVGIVLGMGPYLPLHDLTVNLLPFLKNSRTPGRILVCTVFAVVLLAANGWRVLERQIRLRNPIWPELAVGIVLLLLGAVGGAHIRSLALAQGIDASRVNAVVARSVAGGALPLISMLVLLYHCVHRGRSDLWKWLGVCIVGGSLAWEGARQIQFIRADALYASPPAAIDLEAPHLFHVLDVNGFSNGAALGLHTTGPLPVAVTRPQAYGRFWSEHTINRMVVANVRYLHLQERRVASAPQEPGQWVRAPKTPLARAKLYWNVQIANNDREALRAIDIDSIGFRETLLLHDAQLLAGDQEQEPISRERREEARIRFRTYEPGLIELEVDNPNDGWLYLAEQFSPGWHAQVDGVPVPLVRAFVAFEALPIPAGTHQVKLFYGPKSLQLGLVISASCVLLMGLAVAIEEKTRRFRFLLR